MANHNGDAMEVPEKIRLAAARLKEGRRVNRITVRDFLKHFDAERRGYRKVQEIRKALDSLDLVTEPDFEIAWIDDPIWLKLKHGVVPQRNNLNDDAGEAVLGGTPAAVAHAEERAKDALISVGGSRTEDQAAQDDEYFTDDPTFRIGGLAVARKVLVYVSNDAPLKTAVTLMLHHDFSQLPIMQGQREVRGVVSWRSIGSKLFIGNGCAIVGDCGEDARVIDSHRTLFEAIPMIVEAGYVLVRDRQDRRIISIVTASDLSLQFQELSEPFLLIKEIELYVRQVLRSRLVTSDFDVLKAPSPPAVRKIEDVDELTMAQYITLFRNDQIWNRIGLKVDSREFAALLEKVRSIRNEVMHFDRDPITKDQLDVLKRAARFMQKLNELSPDESRE
ncbi:MAG: CBS domain-containing protein [Xanthobacteraceae bacterium]